MRAAVIAVGLLSMTFADVASAQISAAAPMDVSRLATLKSAASRTGESAWARVAYQEYINGLIDGLMDKEGERFCLPADIRAARAEIIFTRLSADTEEAVKNSTPKDLVAVAVRKFLAQKYPCKR